MSDNMCVIEERKKEVLSEPQIQNYTPREIKGIFQESEYWRFTRTSITRRKLVISQT